MSTYLATGNSSTSDITRTIEAYKVEESDDTLFKFPLPDFLQETSSPIYRYSCYNTTKSKVLYSHNSSKNRGLYLYNRLTNEHKQLLNTKNFRNFIQVADNK